MVHPTHVHTYSTEKCGSRGPIATARTRTSSRTRTQHYNYNRPPHRTARVARPASAYRQRRRRRQGTGTPEISNPPVRRPAPPPPSSYRMGSIVRSRRPAGPPERIRKRRSGGTTAPLGVCVTTNSPTRPRTRRRLSIPLLIILA